MSAEPLALPFGEPEEVAGDSPPSLVAPAPALTPGLTAEDLAMLRFAGEWWKDGSAKDQAIRDRFDVAPTRFHQRVNALLDNPAALAAEPVICHRLQRLKAARSRLRRGPSTWSVRRGR